MHLRVFAITIIALLSLSIAGASHTYFVGDADTLYMEVNTDSPAYLPSQKINVTYYVYLPNGRVVSDGMGKWYLNNSENQSNVANGTLVSGHGELHIDLGNYNVTPPGSKMDYLLTLVYREDNASAKGTATVTILNPDFFSYDLFTAPVSGGYYPGSFFEICINSPIGKLPVNYVEVSEGNFTISNLTGLYLDKDGHLRYNMKLPEDILPGTVINLSADIIGVVKDFYLTVQRDYGLNLMLNAQNNLISGDSVTIAVTNASGIEDPYYHFYVRDVHGNVIYRYYTAQNFTTFRVPRNFTGYLFFVVDVYNKTQKIGELSKYREIKAANMELYFDRESYHARDTFHAILNFRSNVMSDPTFIYELYASYDGVYYDLVERIETTAKVINITVPQNPPVSYRVRVTAIDEENQETVQAFIYYSTPAIIDARIITKSPYATGVFTPGEVVEIEYNVTGNFRNGILYYGFDNEFYSNPKVIRVDSGGEGHISVTIPEDMKKGLYALHLKLVYDGGEIEKEVLIPVDDNPPWSQYLILTMPAGDFFSILVIVVVVVFGVLIIKYPPRRGASENAGKGGLEIKEEILEEESK